MGNYEHYKKKTPSREVFDFDWCITGPPRPKFEIIPITLTDVKAMGLEETAYDRKLRMLRQVSQACMACSMCELGRCDAIKDKTIRDPHIFSNMNPTRFIVVGQNPGWNELAERMPFVGDSGRNFDSELAVNGLSRNDFYICNTVRCFTKDNTKPTAKHINKCKPFLAIEMNLINPLLVVTLGAPAFETLCPNNVYGECLQKITKSDEYNINVFAVYHPSPRNLTSPGRSKMFKEQMKVMCSLVKELKKKHGI